MMKLKDLIEFGVGYGGQLEDLMRAQEKHASQQVPPPERSPEPG